MACENLKPLELKSNDNSDSHDSSSETGDTESDTETQTNTRPSTDIDTGTGTGSAVDTDTSTDTWFDTDFDDLNCPVNQWSACYENDVWCMDIHGNPIGLLQDCNSKENCKPGSPATCECTANTWSSQCYEGDVWSFGYCEGRHERLDICKGCKSCVNKNALEAECQATVFHAYQKCGTDGNVRWFDSCGVENDLVALCGDSQCAMGCRNTTTTAAECVIADDFTPCVLVTDPDRSYDICVAGTCVSPGCGDASCNIPGPHFPLADTNQRECYNDSGPMSCPNPGEDFYGQDAQYGWDATHLETQRYIRTTAKTNQPIVKDNVTGLEWQGCIAGLSGVDCASGSAIYSIWSQALQYCDSLDWGGQTDWRLPDPYELFSILDNRRYDPAIDPAAFPATPNNWFWSSSSYVDDPSEAWFVNHGYGFVNTQFKIDPLAVRCVRNEPSATTESRFLRDLSVAAEPTVLDLVTKLQWQGCTAGFSGHDCDTGSAEYSSWKQALQYCEGLYYGGHSDWRLPNRTELQSIIDHRKSSPAIDSLVFLSTPSVDFWTSTSFSQDSRFVWIFAFDFGRLFGAERGHVSRVRCVRSTAWNDCQVLHWFDDESTDCAQKEFCGAYMYEGLQTFDTLEACESALHRR